MESGRGKQYTLGHSALLLERIHQALRFFTDGSDEPVVPDWSPALGSGSVIDHGGRILENIHCGRDTLAKGFHAREALAVAECGIANAGDSFADRHAPQGLAVGECECPDRGYTLGYDYPRQAGATAEGMTPD